MPSRKVVLCTSSDFRHRYIASKLASYDIELMVIHEHHTANFTDDHFKARAIIEREFFEFDIHQDYKAVYVNRGDINSSDTINLINRFEPDIFVSYGCAIINKEAISGIECNKVNVHLGLSPYYRGTATNFWPIYNGEIHYCGVTFHELSLKIDGGPIFHQFALDKYPYKTVHHLGNSLIKRIPIEFLKVMNADFIGIKQDDRYFDASPRHYYKTSDYNEEKANLVNLRFDEVVKKFLKNNNEVKVKYLK